MANINQLPKKVLAPIKKLVGTKAIKEEELPLIVSIAAHLQHAEALLPWLIHYKSLNVSQSTIEDTISMATAAGRKIDPWWSQKRWNNEHSELSRLETLRKLSSELICYPTSNIDALLPSQFPGYVIKTSRRLGMEGLRQQHCVASYHDRLKNNPNMAIVVVFAEKKRWTCQVELISHDKRDFLGITQIESRFRQQPSAEVRALIHDLLIIDPKAAKSIDQDDETLSYHEQFNLLVPILRDRSVTSVVVEFDGGGDSGAIESSTYLGNPNFDSDELVLWSKRVTTYDVSTGAYSTTVVEEPQSIDSILCSAVDEWLDGTGVDWYNNSGGYGTFYLNIKKGTYGLDVFVRIEESENMYSDEFDLNTVNLVQDQTTE